MLPIPHPPAPTPRSSPTSTPTWKPNASAAPRNPARPSADTTVLSNVFFDMEAECQGWLAVSPTRAAVYAPGNPAKMSLVWVDRQGRTEALSPDQDLYREVSLSPDGTKA